MRVRDVMTAGVHTLPPAGPCEDAWNFMRQNHIHHVVVTRGSKVVGVLSERDCGGRNGASNGLVAMSPFSKTAARRSNPAHPLTYPGQRKNASQVHSASRLLSLSTAFRGRLWYLRNFEPCQRVVSTCDLLSRDSIGDSRCLDNDRSVALLSALRHRESVEAITLRL
jgi:hypothetical protein